MHHYPFHIGDFRAGSVHLTKLERWIYRDLLDCCYDTEKPLPLDHQAVCRMVGARSAEEKDAVDIVLEEKFERTEDGYFHARVVAELEKYRGKATSAKNANKARWGLKSDVKSDVKSDAEQMQIVSQPRTKNQEPITNNQNTPPLPPDGGVAGLQNKKPEKPKPEESEAGFEKFWQVWPKSDRKQAKGLCLKAWKKAGAERHAADILAHIEACKRSENWSKEGGQFIPAPLVYLNQKRWEGAELAESVTAGESKFGSGFEGVM